MEHVYHNTETGKMIMIALQSLQMEAGISAHLITDPTPLLVYTEKCWISQPEILWQKTSLPWNSPTAGILGLHAITMHF
jgi:hypothetical protein